MEVIFKLTKQPERKRRETWKSWPHGWFFNKICTAVQWKTPYTNKLKKNLKSTITGHKKDIQDKKIYRCRGSAVGVSSGAPKSFRFGSRSEHVPRLRVWSPGGCIWGATDLCFSVSFMFLSLSISSLSEINKHVLRWELKKKKKIYSIYNKQWLAKIFSVSSIK